MQTITTPYTTDADGADDIVRFMRLHGCVVRTGYAQANDADGNPHSEKELRDILKARFPNHPLGSWAIHCATRDAMRLRRQRPDGRMVFGGQKELERRNKGLITNAEWQQRRHSRPIDIVGDRTYWGNRHLRLSPDGLKAMVTFLGREIVLHLPNLAGKWGKLMPALAALTAAGEIPLHFRLDRKQIAFTFDPMDLQKLPADKTLEDVQREEREALGHKPRGRPRKEAGSHTRAHRITPIPSGLRPVHPDWRPTIPTTVTRAVGIDLNPQCTGITVIEIPLVADPQKVGAVRILEHRLVDLTIPINGPPEAMATAMARCARMATSLARKWHAATVFHEEGLGKLRWHKKSNAKSDIQTVNFWSRNALIGGLGRRCSLGGVRIQPVWGGYSTTIGNMCFDLPDACAAAAEIARRGIAASRGSKDRLPAVPPRVASRRWKDGELPEASVNALADAGSWPEVHRAIKAAPIGVRRLHPPTADPGRLFHDGIGYAVRHVKSRRSGRIAIVIPVSRHTA